MKKLSKGEAVEKHTAVYFESLDAVRKVFTEKRLEVLHVVNF